jgi:hypothetical protein
MTGPIGHGKSTFAKAITEAEPSYVHFETSLIIGEVVNALHAATSKVPSRDDIDSINNWLEPLPAILLTVVHARCNFGQIQLDANEVLKHPVEYEKLFLHIDNLHREPQLLTQRVTKENKEAYRPILQWFGGYLVKRVDTGIWYKEIVGRIRTAQKEGIKVCIVGGLRFPNDAALLHSVGAVIIKVYRPGHLQYDLLDPTERERDNITVDCTIVSNGTIDDLKLCAKNVLGDIRANSLQKQYYAATTQPQVGQ